MKKAFVFILIVTLVFPVFAGKTMLKENAVASYYGAQYDGRPTSSGEIFDMYAMTAAHKTLPFGTMLEVTNLDNGNSVIVRVNDRGPFVKDREIDVSQGAAEKLGMITSGTARVSIAIVDGEDALEAPSSAVSVSVPAPAPAVPSAGSHFFPAKEEKPSPLALPSPVSVPPAKDTAPAPVFRDSGYSGPLWRIQLGSFTREENAIRMVRSLRAAGLEPAYEKSDGKIRVVLASVTDYSLENVKKTLNEAGFRDYLLRREN